MDLNKRRIGAYRKAAGKPSEDEGAEKAEQPASGRRRSPGESAPAETPGTRGRAKRKQQDRGTTEMSIPPDALLRLTRKGKPGRRHVAELLLLLGKDEAAEVLKHLDEATVEKITNDIAGIGRVDKGEAAEVLAEFGIAVSRRGRGASGGAERAREMLAAAFGSDEAERILYKVVPEAAPRPFDFLNDLEPQQIHMLVRKESPAVVSIIVAHLNPKVSAGVLALLDSRVQHEVVRRVARLGEIDHEVIARIEESFREKIRTTGKVVSSEVDGKGVLAQILRHLAPQEGEKLLDDLRRDAPELSEDVRDRLFTTDTLLLIDDQDLQRVLQDFPDREIALILKGKSDEIRSKVLMNMSERRRTFVMDEYQRLGPTPKRDVDEATKQFISVLKKLEADGKIVVRRADERYVE